MYHNRITKFLNAMENKQSDPAKRNPPKPPTGFTSLPAEMRGNGSTEGPVAQPDLYRIAFEAAKAAVEEKLLQLLRSRMG